MSSFIEILTTLRRLSRDVQQPLKKHLSFSAIRKAISAHIIDQIDGRARNQPNGVDICVHSTAHNTMLRPKSIANTIR